MIKIKRANLDPENFLQGHKKRFTLTDLFLQEPKKKYFDSRDPLEQGVSQYPNHLVPINLQTHVLKDTFLSMCKDKIEFDISMSNIDPIADKDTYIEFDISTFMNYNGVELSKILQTHKVIICDFEDGFGGKDIHNKNFASYIMSMHIIPREVLYLSTNVEDFELPQLNIKGVSLPVWMHITIACTGFLCHAYRDNSARQHYLDMLDSDNKNFALCLNYKPRVPRLAFLAELHRRKILDTLDWSLVGYDLDLQNPFTDHTQKQALHDNDNDKFNMLQQQYKEKYYDIVTDFIDSVQLPKYMFRDSNIVSISPELVGKYYWHVVSETILQFRNGFINNGIVTEKTFKAMIAGAMPLICGPNGTDSYLEKLGFKIHRTDIDEYDNLDKSFRLADCYQDLQKRQQLPNKQDVMHNAELLLDKKFVCSKIIQPLMDNCNG